MKRARNIAIFLTLTGCGDAFTDAPLTFEAQLRDDASTTVDAQPERSDSSVPVDGARPVDAASPLLDAASPLLDAHLTLDASAFDALAAIDAFTCTALAPSSNYCDGVTPCNQGEFCLTTPTAPGGGDVARCVALPSLCVCAETHDCACLEKLFDGGGNCYQTPNGFLKETF